MNKKYLLTLMTLLACSMSLFAYDFGVNGIYYNVLSSAEVEVTSFMEFNEVPPEDYSGTYYGSVIIPETVSYNGVNYAVTAIGDYAFCRCAYLESVTIPNSVTCIGDYAFAYNPYCDVICYADPQNTTMGNFAFYAEDYYDRTLYISPYMDYYYWEEMGWTQYFYNIASSYFEIDEFGYSIISSREVEVMRYANKDIEEVSIPESVNFGYDYNDKTYFVTSIGDNLFSNCSNLKSVSIPMCVTRIGEMAFSYCSALTDITIPEYVTTIGDGAFMGCTSLTSITIPDGVTTLSDMLFRYCRGLTNVTFNGDVTTIGVDAFQDCTGLTNILIPNSVTAIGVGAFSGCKRLKNINIPYSVTSIGDYAFLRCDSLADVTIGKSVNTIGDYAFDGCGLTSLNIPKSVISIGFRAFSSNGYLTSITVENGNPVYDSRNNCNAIIETSSNTLITGCGVTVIPQTVTVIGAAAFFNAPYHYVRIPASVISIGNKAFAGCWVRSVVCYATTPPIADAELFLNGSTSTYSVTVPNASIELYKNAVGWNFFHTFYGLGDVNGDGKLSISDVTGIIDQLLSSDELPDYCDVNGDGVVNITDVTALISMLLSGN